MDQTLFALPILAGKTAAARAFLAELEGGRKGQYAASERRLGLTREVWAIQPTPQGDLYVVYFAASRRVRRLVQAARPGDDRRGPEHPAARAAKRDPLRLRGLSGAASRSVPRAEEGHVSGGNHVQVTPLRRHLGAVSLRRGGSFYAGPRDGNRTVRQIRCAGSAGKAWVSR